MTLNMKDGLMELKKKLAEPFPKDKIHWRVGATTQDKKKGIALAYVDARDVMDRFDDVMGVNWQNDYPFPGCCRIGLQINGEWLWRSNGAGETDYEGTKGMYSDAFKRAAVLWGVGRYLYALPNTWVPIEQKGKSYVIKSPPNLPNWALPGYAPPVDSKLMHETIISVKEAIKNCDDGALHESLDGFNEDQKVYLWRKFNSAERGTIKEMLKK